jgi:hypothetical protein
MLKNSFSNKLYKKSKKEILETGDEGYPKYVYECLVKRSPGVPYLLNNINSKRSNLN